MATQVTVATVLADMDFDSLFAASAPSAKAAKASTKKDAVTTAYAAIKAAMSATPDFAGKVLAIIDPTPDYPGRAWNLRANNLAYEVQENNPAWVGYYRADKGLLMLVCTPYANTTNNPAARQWAKTRENWRKSEQDAAARPHAAIVTPDAAAAIVTPDASTDA